MRNVCRSFAFVTLLCLLAIPVQSASAATLAQVTSGSATIAVSAFDGQSFTVVGSGSYDDITFNFYSPGLTPYAIGTGYLFSSVYTGTPAGLSSLDPGFLGSATASGGAYDFNSSLTLVAGQKYFFYEDTSIPAGAISGNVSYPGGDFYFSSSNSSTYATTTSANFLVTGQSVSQTPEPSTLVLLGTGVLGLAGAVRRRFQT